MWVKQTQCRLKLIVYDVCTLHYITVFIIQWEVQPVYCTVHRPDNMQYKCGADKHSTGWSSYSLKSGVLFLYSVCAVGIIWFYTIWIEFTVFLLYINCVSKNGVLCLYHVCILSNNAFISIPYMPYLNWSGSTAIHIFVHSLITSCQILLFKKRKLIGSILDTIFSVLTRDFLGWLEISVQRPMF